MALSLKVLRNEKLPCDSCGGACCTFAPFTVAEARAARIANGGTHPAGSRVVPGLPAKDRFGGGSSLLIVKADGETCAYLQGGRCTIYEARPQACRAYGRIPEMPCQVLHPREAQRAVRNLVRAAARRS